MAYIVALQCSFYLTKMNQPYIYTYPPFWISHLGHLSALSRVPALYSAFSLVIYFYIVSICVNRICVNPSLLIHPISPIPLGIHIFVLYICHDILTEIKPKSCKNTFCQFLSKSGLKTNDIVSLLHCKNIEMTRKTMLLLRDILWHFLTVAVFLKFIFP